MLASNVIARREVADGLARAGRPADTRFMVTPVVVNPFRREVVIDLGDRYEKGNLWFDPLPHFRPAGFGMPQGIRPMPEVQQALRDATGAGVICAGRDSRSSRSTRRLPPDGIWINDYRYANAGTYGWSSVKLQ